ncbi:hypothetical protein [Bowmanella denitrificans]|uniref:baseplate complex protein n=1 Tax=Bowmanella denitrificans TaxID=366582 RepID=UPI000C9C1843|nr:hypothetical protein [Bowmanella denitrificans]
MALKLVLDGQRIPGNEITLQVTYTIDSDDLSGQGSSTEDAETGNKAQVMRVRLKLDQRQPENLKLIHSLASKLDENGARHIYTIVNTTAEAMGIRQVTFSQELAVREDDTTRVWFCTFLLKEHRSVAEKQQEQQNAKELPEQQQSAQGTAVESAETQPELTDSEKILQRFENMLAGT